MANSKPVIKRRKDNTITRADIAKIISRDTELNIQASEDLLLQVLGHITGALEAGQDVKISGFGVFHVKDKSARRGRNPATGAPKIIDARRVVTFRPSDIFRQRVADQLAGKQKT